MTKPPSRLVFAIIALLNSAWVFYFYLAFTHIGVLEPAKLANVINGTAERPYVYRALVPWLAKMLAPFTPEPSSALVNNLPAPIKQTFLTLGESGYAREAAIVLSILFLALIGFAFAQQLFIHALGTFNQNEEFVLPLFAQIFILPLSFGFGYLYDLPQLLLVTMCLLFMLGRQWTRYFLTLGIASLNKETSALLLVVFVIYYAKRLPFRTVINLLTIQVAIFTSIRIFLLYLFRENAGTPMLMTFIRHYEQYVYYPPTLLLSIAFFFSLGWLCTRSWKQKHPFLRAGAAIPVLIFFLYFVSGMPLEFRVFLDALPVIGALLHRPTTALVA